MPEHLLNGPQIGAPIEEMRGEGMSEHMRADRPFDPGAAAVCLDDLPEADPAQRPAAGVDEQPVDLSTRGLPAADQLGPAAPLIAPDPVGGLIADWDQPLFAPLAD